MLAHVARNLYEAVPEDEEREVYKLPEFVEQMVGRGILGDKTKGGFYQKRKGEGGARDIWTLDVAIARIPSASRRRSCPLSRPRRT